MVSFQINSTTGMLVIAALLAFAIVNALSASIYAQVRNLVVDKSAEENSLVGDRVTGLYAKYLFGQVMAGSFFKPSLAVLGNPENDRIVRAVKRSDEYKRIQELASWIRNLPINVVPYCV
jgi:hypothetical protein